MKEKKRTENSIRNVLYGVIVTILNAMISFASRTVFVKTLGEAALGLNGLFVDIIAILSLTELGIGMAIIYHLYRPFYDEDTNRISQLMSLYRNAYSIISIVILFSGLIITPFVDKLVTDINYPLPYIRLVFILFVIRTSVSYLYAYKTALLNADQKQYVVSISNVIFKLIFTIISIVVLWVTKNYIAYLVVQILQSIIPNYILAKYIDKQYPYVDYRQRLNKEDRNAIFRDVKDIFLKRVSGVITSSTDSVLISTLVSTIQVGLYSNYVVIFSIIRTLKSQLTTGIAASIGNLSVTESPEKCASTLSRLTFLYFGFSIIMCSGLLAVGNQFITMWIGDSYIMEFSIVLVAVFNLYLEIICDPLWQFLEVSGLFKYDKYIGVIGSTVNLIVSLILGSKIGIVGIFIGTVCTQMIQMVLKTLLLFKRRLGIAPTSYFIMWVKMLVAFPAAVILQSFIGNAITMENLLLDFLVKGILAVGSSGVLSIIVFTGTMEVKYLIKICINIFCKTVRQWKK